MSDRRAALVVELGHALFDRESEIKDQQSTSPHLERLLANPELF
jgi:hypothetical protein